MSFMVRNSAVGKFIEKRYYRQTEICVEQVAIVPFPEVAYIARFHPSTTATR